MSQHLKLSPRDKLKIERLYAKGLKPAEICAELSSLHLNPRQVTQFLYKRGWTKRRAEIEEVKQESVLGVLEQARREGIEDFKDVLDDIAASLRIDAQRLRDGWDELVENAADASALMRSKALLLARVMRVYGLDKEADASPQAGLNFFVLSALPVRVDPVDAAKPVETAPLNEERGDL